MRRCKICDKPTGSGLRYCSPECKQQAKIKPCKLCGKPCVRVFCSHSCSAKYWRHHSTGTLAKPRRVSAYRCKKCGQKVDKKPCLVCYFKAMDQERVDAAKVVQGHKSNQSIVA